jgi:cytochrome c biogenesis protein CcmG, thiol:disulfide interchange protein DsbE
MTIRSRLIVGTALFLVVVLMSALFWGLRHVATSKPNILGTNAPPLAIETTDGSQVRVWQLQGRPVVVNFWASWCTPCVQESQVLSTTAAIRSDVAFVGADVQDTWTALRQFEAGHPHAYPVGPPVVGSQSDYGVVSLPVTFFLDKQGRVAAYFSGPIDAQTLDHYLVVITT